MIRSIPIQVDTEKIVKQARTIYQKKGQKDALEYLDRFIGAMPLQLNAPYYPALLRLKVVRKMIQLETIQL